VVLDPRLAEDDKICGYIDAFVACARRVFAEYGLSVVIPGVGKSAEDFAYAALEDWLTDPRLKNKDLPYLLKGIRNDIIDALRSSSHRTTEIMSTVPEVDPDPPNTKCLDELHSGQPRPDDQLYEKEFKELALANAGGDRLARDMVVAVLDFNELKPAEIANLLGVPVEQIYTKQKVLRRRLLAIRPPGGAS
jgi:DNA-directed RNA polymerase specialized sigma24 family protein